MIPRLFRIRRILVPIDFSASAEKALRYAVLFAEQFDAKITLLHVVPVPYYPTELGAFPATIPTTGPSTGTLQARLDADAARFIPAGLHERTLCRVGVAFDEICSVARETEADLIIIATHGHTGLKHILVGSTAERVVRHAPCPVLVVREHEHEFA
jgi:nucleotide-binding universal stress UspA family protein